MSRKKDTSENKDEEKKTINTKKIVDDIKKELNEEKSKILEEINDMVEKQVEFRVSVRMREEEKRLVRGKNAKIIKRNILITILLVIVGYLAYCLYSVDYFKLNKIEENKNISLKEENTIKDDSKDAESYIEKYSYLVDRMQINDSDIFEFYSLLPTKDNIPNDLKLKIAYKNVDEEDKEKNQNLISFKSDNLHASLKSIFGDDVDFKDNSFMYNNTKFLYYNDNYLGEEIDDSDYNFLYKIYNARESDNLLIFDIVFCKLSSDNKLLDIQDKVILDNYNNEDLSDYVSILPRYQYTFENKDGDYVYSKIEDITTISYDVD